MLLDPRPVPQGDAAEIALLEQYAALADRLQATASFYDHEVRKNHHKLRAMSVLAGVSAGGAGATVGALAQPQFPDIARPGVASVGVSLAVLAGLFAVLPHAHQYILKEAGYQRQAERTRAAYIDLEAGCGPTLVQAEEADLAACVQGAQQALAEARTFPADSPCKPPPDAELDRMVRRAR